MLRFGRNGPPKWTPQTVYPPLVGLLVTQRETETAQNASVSDTLAASPPPWMRMLSDCEAARDQKTPKRPNYKT